MSETTHGPEKKPSFERNLSRLEQIAAVMERADTPLDESVKLYEEGVKLSLECAETLKQAGETIAILRKTVEGIFEEEPVVYE
jgi:exodeoxyribonuclease VII small subunit